MHTGDLLSANPGIFLDLQTIYLLMDSHTVCYSVLYSGITNSMPQATTF